MNGAALSHQFALAREYDFLALLPQIKCSVFIVHGRFDFWATHEVWGDARNRFPNSEFHLFEESGHYPMLEEQERFDRKLTAWFNLVANGSA